MAGGIDTFTNQYFVEVIVPLRIGWIPVYRSERKLSRGEYASVVFSNKKYFGVVLSENISPDSIKTGTTVLDILPENPCLPKVSEKELKLWEFLSDYYMCSLGEVYRVSRPLLLLRAEKALSLKVKKLESRLLFIKNNLEKKHRSLDVVKRLNEEYGIVSEKLSFLTSKLAEDNDSSTETPHKPILLKGTERFDYYTKNIEEAQHKGGQVLILTPDNSTCNRFEKYFKSLFGEDKVEVFTPDTSPTERALVSSLLRNGRSLVVIGTKSSVFLPFQRLSLVIIDEESDELYKQHDTAPRYNGRDTAVALSRIHSAKIILGASCPSLESLYNCLCGKYTLKELLSPSPLGDLCVIDIKAEQRKRGMKGSFSQKLIGRITECTGKDGIILIRGWEKAGSLESEIKELLSRKENIKVMTFREFKRDESSQKTSLVAVLQADALVSSEDFRSDEKALAVVTFLRERAQRVVIQTSVPSRFDCSRNSEELLSERRQFAFPPYTRLVEVRHEGTDKVLSQHFFKRDKNLSLAKKTLRETLPKGSYPDVDPL